jgi:hypothetical protein
MNSRCKLYCEDCNKELNEAFYVRLHADSECEVIYCEECLKKELNESYMRRRD